MDIPDRLGEVVQDPTSEREVRIWHELLGVVREIGDLLDEQLRDIAELGITEFVILYRLRVAPSGTMTMTDLADGLAVSRSGMTHRVDKLESAGLLRRSASPRDERSRIVTLTDAGCARIETLAPHHVNLLHHLLFEDAESAELDDLEALLGRARARLESSPPRSVRRRHSHALRERPGR